jgi:hypothetical protein
MTTPSFDAGNKKPSSNSAKVAFELGDILPPLKQLSTEDDWLCVWQNRYFNFGFIYFKFIVVVYHPILNT